MPSWPTILVAGEADDLRRHLAAGIVAAVLVLLVQTLDAERHRALRRFRRESASRRTRIRRRPQARRQIAAASSRARARATAARAGVASIWSRNAHSDFTGVEIASASPKRSTMRPRCAGTSISREKRAAPCPCRKSLSTHCRYSERTSSTTNSAASAPNSSSARSRGSCRAAAPRALHCAAALISADPPPATRRPRRAPAPAAACAATRARSSRRAPAFPTSTARATAGRTRRRTARARACSRSSSTKRRRAWWRDVTSDSAQPTSTHSSRMLTRVIATRLRSRAASRRAAARPFARRRAAPRCAHAGCVRSSAADGLIARPTMRERRRGSAASRDRHAREPRIAAERLRRAGEEALDDPILERMEADHGEAPAGVEQRRDAGAARRTLRASSRFTAIRRAWKVRAAGS